MNCYIRDLIRVSLVLLISVQCVFRAPKPLEQMVLAKTAMLAAKEVESARLAPGLWARAEYHFLKANELFGEGYYQEAKRYFVKAKTLAEKAENISRLKQFSSGN